MKIHHVGLWQDPNAQSQAQAEAKAKSNSTKPLLTHTEDTFVPSSEQMKSQTYAADTVTIDQLREKSEAAYRQLRDMVQQLMQRQGKASDLAQGTPVDATTQAEAQALIGEGGALSAETVSDNIVEFAKAVSGGDREAAETLRGAIDRGFAEAAKLFGGSLPQISQDTQALVHEKLDAWLSED